VSDSIPLLFHYCLWLIFSHPPSHLLINLQSTIADINFEWFFFRYSQSHFSCAVGGHPRTKFLFKKSATQPVQLDVQAKGVNWLPTQARQLPAGASSSAWAGLAKGNLARGLQRCWSHPSSPKNKKVSFLGLGCSVSYRPVWPSKNVVLKEKKQKNGARGAPQLCKKNGICCTSGAIFKSNQEESKWKISILFIILESPLILSTITWSLAIQGKPWMPSILLGLSVGCGGWVSVEYWKTSLQLCSPLKSQIYKIQS
jgi:hypothetical protein